MIVIAHQSNLLLVRQPDHARSSREIAAAWRRPELVSPDLWNRFLVGVTVHDDGWIDAELQPALNEDGRPRDFKTTPVREHVEIWRRSVDMALQKGPLVGLVVALHAHALYEHHVEPTVPEDVALAAAFTNELARTIDALKGDVQNDACLEVLRDLIGFFDAVSLMLLGAIPRLAATGALVMDSRRRPLSLSWESDRVFIEPWPFSTRTVQTSLTARRLQPHKFRGGEDFDLEKQAMEVDETTTLSWTLSPRPR